MNSKKALFIIGSSSLIIACIFAGIHIKDYYSKNLVSPSQPEGKLLINNKSINLELATTQAEQVQGLSDRSNLPQDQAMLFVFDHPDMWGIWMKDMNFSLDIFWLDDKYNIITIQENVSSSTYPHIFYPSRPAAYVIEAQAGFAAENHIEVGTHLDISR